MRKVLMTSLVVVVVLRITGVAAVFTMLIVIVVFTSTVLPFGVEVFVTIWVSILLTVIDFGAGVITEV
jgi:hypothetical protein